MVVKDLLLSAKTCTLCYSLEIKQKLFTVYYTLLLYILRGPSYWGRNLKKTLH